MNKEAFIKEVWEYYHEHKRNDQPWRKTTDPYRIMVSEIMLQQTQVDRVTQKYLDFIEQFPTTKSLAQATLADVLKAWQGLGYNRRAKFLKQASEKIQQEFNGTFPETVDELIKLPGIGKNTAAAIMAYAFNTGVPYIETNIRTVYIFHFFKNTEDVHDTDIEKLVVETMDKENPREWFWAIMDYGTHLKKTYGNNIQKSKHYVKQKKFQGSRRQKRGAIIKYLTLHDKANLTELQKETKEKKLIVKDILEELQLEDMIEKKDDVYRIKG